MLKDRRKIVAIGGSLAITIPSTLEKGKAGTDATLAANRVMLVDPRGLISEDDLFEFLERVIEPRIWSWLEAKRRKAEAAAQEEESP